MKTYGEWRYRSVGIATGYGQPGFDSRRGKIFFSTPQRPEQLGYWLDDRGVGVRFPAGARDFSLPHNVSIEFEDHLASCTLGTRGVKLTALLHLVQRLSIVELYFHSAIRLLVVVLIELRVRESFAFVSFLY
jgi:hypothetical protein